MAAVESITITGLKEFGRQLKALDKDLPKGLRVAGNEAAALVVSAAKPTIPSGPERSGHAVSSVKARSTRTAVRVSAGGNRFPYYAWLDFGGRGGRNKKVVRPFFKSGRYLYPAFVGRRDEVQQRLVAALLQVARDAGLEVT